MKKICVPLLLLSCTVRAQVVPPSYKTATAAELYQQFQRPPAAAAPWVLWYWMQASVSKAGITADLEAMKAAGIGGANLVTVKGVANPPLMEPTAAQLSPRWWEMVQFAIEEADRIGLQLAIHIGDGFALAGGPWITPELSMQKVVHSSLTIQGGRRFNDTLPQPESYKGYYKDIAVFAYPSREPLQGQGVTPVVTASKPDTDVSFLAKENNTKTFSSNEPCWIQYAYRLPYTCRAVVIRTNGNNYQAHRLIIQVSDDGVHFRTVERLQSPRHGWQDTDADVTHAIQPVTARYFRFLYDKEGSAPGAEDLDAAKWKPSFKIKGIELLTAPRLHQYEGKSGVIWRISPRTNTSQLPDSLCIPKEKIIQLTAKMDATGRLVWQVPPGRWTILRMGHTSTGHTNATGGAGIGLECDKFNPVAIQTQYDNWFGETVRRAGPALAARVIKLLYIDSWECGSQNWSPVFRNEFKRRRGYDLLPYLPAMAGVPVTSAAVSEKVLYDVRQTIAELVNDNFYGTFARLAHSNGFQFTAESVAPTMMSDGMLHYSKVDVPMGEFWLNSPTHDKPNDMLDAISGARIYGKPVVQAEGFTTVRMDWSEHPGSLKTLQDRNYALGVNRVVYHVFAHNPWLDRKPGMTLDGVGLYFQRDQTWWKPGIAWIQYASRCQALLQLGKPVADLAVFTGEEIPRRAVLPERLVTTLPGIMGEARVREEAARLANQGQPLRVKPDGVTHSANMPDPENWTDPLKGYAYDSFNEDALLRLATVRNGRIELPGGASYRMLVLPAPGVVTPDSGYMSPSVTKKINALLQAGATILAGDQSVYAPGLGAPAVKSNWTNAGKGRVLRAPFREASFDALGLAPDLMIKDSSGQQASRMAWTHRTAPQFDLYFIANQENRPRKLELSLRVAGRQPELWDPVTGDTLVARNWHTSNGRTVLPVQLEANASVFVVFHQAATATTTTGNNWVNPVAVQKIAGDWLVQFDTAVGGPTQPVQWKELQDWSQQAEPGIKYYSGTAVYTQSFEWNQQTAHAGKRIWLNLGSVSNLASVTINGIDCGVTWTAPYRVEITKAIQPGVNRLEIQATNTWANRMIGDHTLNSQKPVTWTTAPYRLEGKSLLKAGLAGPVTIETE